MPYTLMKGLAWILLALVLGIVIGWALRHVVAKRQIARARNHHVDTVEMERLRGRVANLEPLVAERDRLRAEIDALAQRGSKGAKAVTSKSDPTVPPPRFLDGADAAAGGAPAEPAAAGPSAAPDLAVAAAVLGRAVALDDLTVIEGVGSKIEELCHGIGIRTWFDLSTTEVSLLRTMLADAGPRFRTHDPASWPEQARLLTEGRWHEFTALTGALSGGRAVEPSAASE
jgi:predicted flap endonuclease-1-like 5' DNA nuclease